LAEDRFGSRRGSGGAARKPGILVVGGDDLLRDLLKTALRNHGFAGWSTGSGTGGTPLDRRHRGANDPVLLDVPMPPLDGPGTLAQLGQVNPEVRCCFITGDSGAYSEAALLQRGALAVLRKPFRLSELIAMVERLTTKGAAIPQGS